MGNFIAEQLVCYLSQRLSSNSTLSRFLIKNSIPHKQVEASYLLSNILSSGIVALSTPECLQKIIKLNDPQLKQLWLFIHDQNLNVEEIASEGYLTLNIEQLNTKRS